MICYRHGVPADVLGLKRLWKMGFEDAGDFIDRYFEDLFRPEDMAVCADGKVPVSMVGYLPCTLHTPEGSFPTAYLYAMATDPRRQGEGLGQKLLRFAYDYATHTRGWTGLVLVPADTGLFRFYAKTDYRTAFSYQTLEHVGVAGTPDGRAVPISSEGYGALREQLLSGTTHLEHSAQFLAHTERELMLTGGGLFRLTLTDGAVGCAAVERSEDGTWCAKELLAPLERQQEALEILATAVPADRLIARTPWVDLTRPATPFGVASWPERVPSFEDHTAYLGLALD